MQKRKNLVALKKKIFLWSEEFWIDVVKGQKQTVLTNLMQFLSVETEST